MEYITEQGMLDSFVAGNDMAILFFSGATCSACQVVQEKLAVLLRAYPNVGVREVNVAMYPALGAQYGVFSAPVILLMVEGRECSRTGVHFDFRALEEKMRRYGSLLQENTL